MKNIENQKIAVEQTAPAPDRAKAYPKVKETSGLLSPDVGNSQELSEWMNNLKNLLHTQSDTQATTLLSLAMSASTKGETSMNAAAATLCDLGPRDALEVLLMSQMTACFYNNMKILTKLQSVTDIGAQERHLNISVRLQRTFLLQIEALKKYRSGGKQTIIIKRIAVNEGGQAVIGSSISTQGGGTE